MKNNYFHKKPYSNIYKSSSETSEVTSQILYGEKFQIIFKNKNWMKIKTSLDNYIGYIKSKSFTNSHKPTYKVFVLKSCIFNKLKNKTKNFLPFAAKISIIQENEKLIEFEKNKWIKKTDIKKIDHVEKNYLKILKLFLDIKYVWGGKTYKGIDCSAILQLLYYYNNKFYPRDTKDQLKYSKSNIKRKKFRRGDIIFWKGHVAICIDTQRLIHAFGPEKKVIIMPINKTLERIGRTTKLVVKKVSSIRY